MCGRFTLRTRLNELLQFYSVESQPEWEPRFNIAPSQSIPVVRNGPDGDRRELVALRWGLIPSWADDIRIGNHFRHTSQRNLSELPSWLDR
jgi:putative SOS response-associated peptidase YedK